jgi:hypothetical protein
MNVSASIWLCYVHLTDIQFDQFALEPDILPESSIIDVIKQRLGQEGRVFLATNDATLRICTVDAWHGTDVSSVIRTFRNGNDR